jgi:hypothetical protein
VLAVDVFSQGAQRLGLPLAKAIYHVGTALQWRRAG